MDKQESKPIRLLREKAEIIKKASNELNKIRSMPEPENLNDDDDIIPWDTASESESSFSPSEWAINPEEVDIKKELNNKEEYGEVNAEDWAIIVEGDSAVSAGKKSSAKKTDRYDGMIIDEDDYDDDEEDNQSAAKDVIEELARKRKELEEINAQIQKQKEEQLEFETLKQNKDIINKELDSKKAELEKIQKEIEEKKKDSMTSESGSLEDAEQKAKELQDNSKTNVNTEFAFSREREKFLGTWRLIEHKLAGRDFLQTFIESRLQDFDIRDESMFTEYEFKLNVCTKLMKINCNIVEESRMKPYSYITKLITDYNVIEPGKLNVKIEGGYNFQNYGDDVSVKDVPNGIEAIELGYEFTEEDGESILTLQEEDDYKKLKKIIPENNGDNES